MTSKKIQNERIVERNITVRCDGFSYRVRLTINGARIDESFDTLQDARAYRDRMRSDAATDPAHRLVLQSRQKKAEFGKLTLTAMLGRYLVEVTPKKRGAQVEAAKIRKLQRYEIAKLPIQMVGRDAVNRFIEVAKREGWSDNNLRKYLMLISSVFQLAVKRWGMDLENPIRSVEVPGNGKARDRRLESGEEDYLLIELKKARNTFIAPIFAFALETAARRGEILKLRWKDVDLMAATAILRNTKNGEDRIIPLSIRAITVLHQIPPSNNGVIFPVTEVQLRQAYEAAKERARKRYEKECSIKDTAPDVEYLSDLRFHDLRHEATSRFFEKGLNVMEVASITGHRTLEMLKRYTHLRAAELVRKLG